MMNDYWSHVSLGEMAGMSAGGQNCPRRCRMPTSDALIYGNRQDLPYSISNLNTFKDSPCLKMARQADCYHIWIYLGAVSLSKRRSGGEICSHLFLNKFSNRMMDEIFILIRDKTLAEFACATLSRHPEYTVQASELRDNSRRHRREMWIFAVSRPAVHGGFVTDFRCKGEEGLELLSEPGTLLGGGCFGSDAGRYDGI